MIRPDESTYLPFLDWLKFLGMFLIVYGHAPGGGLIRFSDPFNPKQLGVICFILVMGFSLARDNRNRFRVLYNCLFEMYVVGIGFAMVISYAAWRSIDDFLLSNHMPFVLGSNVLINKFPANPTTWYIGTYLHFLLLWVFVLRGVRVRAWMIVVSAVVEVPVRALLVEHIGDWRAYMLVTNWITIFLAGMWIGQGFSLEKPPRWSVLMHCLILVGFALLWPQFIAQVSPTPRYTFPFMRLTVGGELGSLMFTSLCVTFLYLTYGYLLFQITRGLPGHPIVRFLARNTVFVFVAHLPFVFGTKRLLHQSFEPTWLRVLIGFLVFYVMLAILSEILFYRWLNLPKLRDAVAHHWEKRRIRFN